MSVSRRRVTAAFALAGLACGRSAPAEGPVRLHTVVRSGPAQRLYVARVDLADPRVHVDLVPAGGDPDGAGHWETTLGLPSVVAREHRFDLAVNACFFEHVAARDGGPADLAKYSAGDPARAAGLVVGDGRLLSRPMPGQVLSILPGHATITETDGPVAGVVAAVGGSWRLLDGGRNVAPDDYGARHARTAAGITADGRTLVLLVADGARPGWAEGLTLRELADAMAAEGCRDAINLDGGGSSTMVCRDGNGGVRVINVPSDGSGFVVPLSVQRPVAYVLGVRVGP